MGSGEKHCVVCGEGIPSNAQKCRHCGSYQGWRRHLDFGNNAIALLIALISVSTLAVDTFSRTFNAIFVDETLPSVSARIVDIDIDSISVLYSNTGTTRAYLAGGALCVVPAVKVGVVLYTSDSNLVRNPKPNELRAAYSVYYGQEATQGVFLEPNTGIVLKAERTNILEMTNEESVNMEAREVAAYCSVSFLGSNNTEAGDFIPVSQIYAKSLGEALSRFPKERLLNAKAVAKNPRVSPPVDAE